MADGTRRQSDLRIQKTQHFQRGLGTTRDATAASVASAVLHDWRGVDLAKATRVQEDFIATAGVTLPAPWGTQDTSAAGAPTLDYIANADNGEYTLTLAATDEVETLTLYWADSLHIDVTKQPYFEARVKIDADTALSADDRVVFGLAAARNATLDSNATHAWFRMEGANQNILYESDDGTTDTDDQDSTVDWVDNTYLKLAIDCADLSSVKFYVDDVLVGTTAIAAATGNLQPYIELQKDAGTVTHAVVIDYIHVAWMR